MIHLSLDLEPPALIDALYRARRDGRRDLISAVTALLDHSDPLVREEAVSLLLTKWVVRELRDVARRILIGDEDEGVRARTALGLAAVASQQTRISDAALLAEVYRDAASSQILRSACIEALSLMTGRPTIVDLERVGARQVQQLLDEIAAQAQRATD